MKKQKRIKTSKLFTLFMTIFLSATLLLAYGKTYSVEALQVNNKVAYSLCNENNNVMDVSYINVGQGDSELIQVNGKNILIDAGPRKSANKVIEYLKSHNITTLDYVIATHPHEDHIGGMAKVLKTFEVKHFCAPKVTHNTRTFENMIKEVKKKGLKVEVLKAGSGDKFDLGEGSKVEVFSPNEDTYDNLNNYSPIMKFTFGENSFLFTGDAEKEVEREVLEKGYNIDSDVLKAGHHGSHSSSSEEFIEAVSPKIAVMSLATHNKYGHPHKETLETFKKFGIKTYQTNLNGDVILESDGHNIIKK